MSPEARVFRPKSEQENNLIDSLMRTHKAEGHIERPSWTQYIAYLINQDVAGIRARYKTRAK